MNNFIKVYQRTWVNELRDSKSKTDILTICHKIINDDTGGTDELTQQLAKSTTQYLTISKKGDNNA